jgi:acetyl-CoA decarbonylase/synthase complex subunit beta
VDKIATENDVKTIEELKNFLKSKNHPVVQRWKEIEEKEKKEEVAAPKIEEAPPIVMEASTLPLTTGGGFKIILKDATITAKKAIIRREGKAK